VSKNINVHPDHYKLAGRERPGKATPKARVGTRQDREAAARYERMKGKKARP